MDKPFLMQVCTLSWSEYLGRIGCGRILQGTLKKGDKILRTHTRWKDYEQTDWEVVSTDTSTCTHLYVTKGLDRAEVEEAGAGGHRLVHRPREYRFGRYDEFARDARRRDARRSDIEEPTVSMFFIVNTSPFASQDGNAITLRQLKARIERETKTDPALRMEDLAVRRNQGLGPRRAASRHTL